MHFIGLVFLDEPTMEKLNAAMDEYKDKEWDWYRPGGRWDGWLLGEEEMKKRETNNGFNFSPDNEEISKNCCLVKDLPADKVPYFFLDDRAGWIPMEYYNAYEKSQHYDGYGAIVPTPDYMERFKEALEKNKDKWVVVVDVHS